jgi:hypothetical protein
MIVVKIRDSRDVRGPLCGNQRRRGEPGQVLRTAVLTGRREPLYAYVPPTALACGRDDRLAAFFAARLRGEPVSLPRSPS